MIIDARKNKDSRELFRTLKDVFVKEIGNEVFIEVLVDTNETAKKVKAFASMSGCQAVAEEKDGYCVVRITGRPCCV
ncbi:MAG: hypothetical protein HY755_03025 [Nitrospirae bacterium]|nr:hypothetical protein [Nitrospirota bacterium]